LDFLGRRDLILYEKYRVGIELSPAGRGRCFPYMTIQVHARLCGSERERQIQIRRGTSTPTQRGGKSTVAQSTSFSLPGSTSVNLCA